MVESLAYVGAPPYALEELTIGVPEGLLPDVQFCALPSDRHVDESRAISPTPAHASLPGDKGIALTFTSYRTKRTASDDGWITNESRSTARNDTLIDVVGIRVDCLRRRARLDRANGKRPGDDTTETHTVEHFRTLVVVSARWGDGRSAKFLVILEADMLATLQGALEKVHAEGPRIRARSPEPASTLIASPTDQQRLHHHVAGLDEVHERQIEHESTSQTCCMRSGPLRMSSVT